MLRVYLRDVGTGNAVGNQNNFRNNVVMIVSQSIRCSWTYTDSNYNEISSLRNKLVPQKNFRFVMYMSISQGNLKLVSAP